MDRIRLLWPNGSLTAVLRDTPTARALMGCLPLRSRAQTWGEEIYFGVPIVAEVDADAVDVVAPGSVCYWVQGRSLAWPWGRTPASRGDECRLVTAVNRIGMVEGDPLVLAAVRDGDPVTLERA
jgi:hypothetical protein